MTTFENPWLRLITAPLLGALLLMALPVIGFAVFGEFLYRRFTAVRAVAGALLGLVYVLTLPVVGVALILWGMARLTYLTWLVPGARWVGEKLRPARA